MIFKESGTSGIKINIKYLYILNYDKYFFIDIIIGYIYIKSVFKLLKELCMLE